MAVGAGCFKIGCFKVGYGTGTVTDCIISMMIISSAGHAQARTTAGVRLPA